MSQLEHHDVHALLRVALGRYDLRREHRFRRIGSSETTVQLDLREHDLADWTGQSRLVIETPWTDERPVASAQDDRDRLLAERDRLRDLVRELTDPSPCEQFDHHGNCQTHDGGDNCAHARAQQYLAALDQPATLDPTAKE